ncbi:cobalt-factor II C20-methyltransferase / precorrin-2 C20-methyltransferase [Prochlorococcus marinus str. NATL2A]|uniref:Cobalt-factor II C20-methyltransferase / precorrin-2 C20-methyltransferase n=1 Tax=Prochlorococcus marinus (strain NATL2A) TaxID=59920 RepID=Q46H23_PROMT|nr:precorrin-2 C(20)-methyltransferase [Prochlorococcus marinus]AAZ59211.1 cobalt-factor II C20-methyltransferase / precorrin-2 C20-methyltransferase [Prochlorococcus marinus str. NATL2A]
MKVLTIAGVGPGDPSLLTLAAVEAIRESTVVSYPVSTRGGDSLAEKIASKWITKDKKKLPLYFPMVDDQNTLKSAWRVAGNDLMKMVDKGERVVFLAQGDISLFSTGSYLSKELEKYHPECVVKLIPGVTSFSAAAAKSKLPLAFQEEELLVLPVPDSYDELKSILSDAASKKRVVVLLKLGKKWEWVKLLLEELDLIKISIFAERIGFSDQQILRASDLPSGTRPYFSLLLIRQSWPLTMP